MNVRDVRPIDDILSDSWNKIPQAYKRAFFFVMCINLLAFGFEMTNYSIHHDDVFHLFINEPVLGIYLGRFGAAWLHYYMQGSHIMPFIQMLQGMIVMTLYGLFIAHFWGVKKTMDMVMVASIMCVFPYMAQIYTYNTTMAVYPIAHFFVVLAVIISTRMRVINILIAALLYMAAFSIYQSVISNAATVFCIWILGKLIFDKSGDGFYNQETAKSTLAVLLSVLLGGGGYLIWVSLMDIDFGSSHDAAEAFKLSGLFNLSHGISEVIKGTRSFFFWPENYFPDFLKKLQQVFLVTAVLICVWLPKRPVDKLVAILILGVTLVTPRILQILHPTGTFHNLTLTAYAVVIAGFALIIIRLGNNFVRNGLSIAVTFLVSGYIIQSNWISTVNLLNTQAHYSTITQILARVRSVPDASWDGKRMVMFGGYNMPSTYPYKGATGVANEYIDNKASHMPNLGKLIRDEMILIPVDQASPTIVEYAATHQPWPHPDSVTIIDGTGVVILSSEPLQPGFNELKH